MSFDSLMHKAVRLDKYYILLLHSSSLDISLMFPDIIHVWLISLPTILWYFFLLVLANIVNISYTSIYRCTMYWDLEEQYARDPYLLHSNYRKYNTYSGWSFPFLATCGSINIVQPTDDHHELLIVMLNEETLVFLKLYYTS